MNVHCNVFGPSSRCESTDGGNFHTGNAVTLSEDLTSEVFEEPSTEKHILFLPIAAAILWTILANIVVMVCTRVGKKLRSATMNMYVFSLAIADALVGVCIMPPMAIYMVYGYWGLGNSICTAWISFDGSLCTVSILHLCLIAYDRWIAVAKPIEYKSSLSSARRTGQLIGAWILGQVLGVPGTIIIRWFQEPTPNECLISSGKYILIHPTFMYYIPLTALVLLYTRCVLGLRAQFRKTHAIRAETAIGEVKNTTQDHEFTKANTSARIVTLTSQQNSQTSRQAVPIASGRHKEQARAVRTIGIVILTFLICWLPFCIFVPIVAYCPACIHPRVYLYSIFLSYLNSAINPCLYFMANINFREAFKTLLRKACT